MPTKKTKKRWDVEIMQQVIRINNRLNEIERKVDRAIAAAEEAQYAASRSK